MTKNPLRFFADAQNDNQKHKLPLIVILRNKVTKNSLRFFADAQNDNQQYKLPPAVILRNKVTKNPLRFFAGAQNDNQKYKLPPTVILRNKVTKNLKNPEYFYSGFFHKGFNNIINMLSIFRKQFIHLLF